MSLFVKIKKQFKGFKLHISFETDGEYLGILGASGSGKSMTLKCIAGIETPDEGRIVLNGRVLFDSEKKINLKPQERNIGYLFQDYALFPNMTVEENIGAGLKFSKSENLKIIKEMIDIFHLNNLEKKYPIHLSGGQQQRVALARCIAYKPDVLLLDEPFSALDSYLKDTLQTEVLELLKYYHGDVLMVTHSMEEVYKFCKNILIIENGNSVAFGDTKLLFQNPQYASVAKITGCKNISKCEVLNDNSIYAVDWGIIIQTKNKVFADIKYVGIHSHSFKICSKDNFKIEKNIMNLKIIKVIEDMYGYSVLFENKNMKNNDENSTNSTLIYKIVKEQWHDIQNNDDLYLKIPEDLVLLLK